MLLAKFIAATAAFPLLLSYASTVLAQTVDPYANWEYLYEDSFENSAGQEVLQQWWLSPYTTRQNNRLSFTLLARRSPISSNGTAAALFAYVADCDNLMYSIERTQFLDDNNRVIDEQSYQRAMEIADPESAFYGVLDNLCNSSN
jgi:hypothetical protein